MTGLSRNGLAKAAGVAPRTLSDFETHVRTPLRNNQKAIQAALEAAGIEFIERDDGAVGILLRK